MDDTELFCKLLRIAPPLRGARGSGGGAAGGVAVWVEEPPGPKSPCPTCAGPAPVYDHTPAQTWRHLDTCECQTYVHARLPRTACPVDGGKQVPAPWAGARSGHTRPFET